MNELSDTIKERLNSSFSGPYTIFFVIFNWQIFTILFTGNDSSKDRISSIESIFHEHSLETLLNPLIATILYIILVPLITSIVDIYKRYIEIKKIEKIESIDAVYNKSWENKFNIVKKISDRILLNTNAMIANGGNQLIELKNLQKYIEALQEARKKDIFEHFSELRNNKEI